MKRIAHVDRLIRHARASDMAAIADIVNAHIVSGVAHFGDRPQSAAEWDADWAASRGQSPWLVAERDGSISGVAYAKRYNPRAAYAWTAETTIYVREGFQGQGIGRALYARLLGILDAQGYRSLLAAITLPNDASVRLHELFGFRHLGTMERVGFKRGAWRAVGWWQRLVAVDDDVEPAPVRSVDEVDREARSGSTVGDRMPIVALPRCPAAPGLLGPNG